MLAATEEVTVSRWGELVPHREDDESCLCGCLDDIVGTLEDAPPVDEFQISTLRPAAGGDAGEPAGGAA
ncbi:hypothetical protein [Streptomyces sp. 3214.6]|uniref:hypothetical protein n=1 Tax=Streptomyces sp. 3214.6 TaxID=1882757 RepID=UPI0009094E26|nr:hypothetical protein [Streptomyces sp. 3214.6]SHI69126.1 hypothetical protein SAMN05444521_8250 [Streptomyces sp. 3214.6]